MAEAGGLQLWVKLTVKSGAPRLFITFTWNDPQIENLVCQWEIIKIKGHSK